MIDYMDAMFDNFSTKFKPDDTSQNPATQNLLAEGITDDLERQQADKYHNFVAKGLFAYKRYRPNIGPTMSVLCTRVKNINHNDWHKIY